MTTPVPQCSCCGDSGDPENSPRRRVIKIAALGLIGGMTIQPGLGHAQVTGGDRLVADDFEGKPVPLRVADLKPGKPQLAYAFDPKTGAVRNESRLEKILLLRVDQSELQDADTKARAAGGVLAYSAICTHQACELKTWLTKEQVIACYCHSSKFRALESGMVASGPAPRSLPALPLKLDGQELVVAGDFTAPPGGAR